MKSLSGKEVCAILIQFGFAQVRQRGSHVIMQKQLNNTTITIPVPMHKTLKTGTLLSIIRQSGLNRQDFGI
ncbi:type II toxin-antitoxin system HicA family toxin [Sphingobacteriales bacterium UPWRP_1]|nr:type II toxin-antitoxin system HicA family toxin [Sphingobacteriales bacterium UPWRP_1]